MHEDKGKKLSRGTPLPLLTQPILPRSTLLSSVCPARP